MATLSPQVSCPSERKAPPSPSPPTPFVLKPRYVPGLFFWIGVEGLGRSANREDCLIRWSSDFLLQVAKVCHAQEQNARDERNPSKRRHNFSFWWKDWKGKQSNIQTRVYRSYRKVTAAKQ